MYSFGIEEEYFVFDVKTRRAVKRANKRFLAAAKKRLGEHLATEMLQSQIEAVSPPFNSMEEGRAGMAGFRRTLAEEAAAHKLGIAAMGTFPLAEWPEQTVTDAPRYDAILDDLQMI